MLLKEHITDTVKTAKIGSRSHSHDRRDRRDHHRHSLNPLNHIHKPHVPHPHLPHAPEHVEVIVREKRKIYHDDDSSSSSSSSSSDSDYTKSRKEYLVAHSSDNQSHSHPRSVVSSIKDHLSGHNRYEQQPTYPPSSSDQQVSEYSQTIVKPHHSSSNSSLEADYRYSDSDRTRKQEVHNHKTEIYPTVLSLTKVIRETVLVPQSKEKSKKNEVKLEKSSKSDKMGKFDSFDYERSNYSSHGGHGSVSDIHYKSKDYSNKSSHISSAHTSKASTFTIPCHHIRIGDLVILQQRPCQVIRITTSAQTGQHRYLGVDLFTKQLHEEPCVVSHPSPSVVLHSLLGPIFKQYRLIDIRDDGKLVAMTESGEIKQGLKVVDQGHLWSRLKEAFGRGSGSVRVLVIHDSGNELAVDYKIVHLAHKL